MILTCKPKRCYSCCRRMYIFWKLISVVSAYITLSRYTSFFENWFLPWINIHRSLYSILLAATCEAITTLGIINCYTQDHWVFFLLFNHCINPAFWTFRASLHIHFDYTFNLIILIRKEDWIQSLKQDYIPKIVKATKFKIKTCLI